MATHYETLGVNQNATQAEIRTAYRNLSRQWHPDRFGQPNHLAQSREEAEAKMKEINDANDVLSNEDERRRYDLGETSFAFGSPAYYDPTDYSFQHTYYGSYTHSYTHNEDELLGEFIKLMVYALLIIIIVCYQLLVKFVKWLKKTKQNPVETYNQRKIREWKEAKRRKQRERDD
jgi:hypothetical protein